MVSRWSGSSLERNSLVTKPAGALATAAVGKTFIRMVACGQTIAHLPQSMQIEGSQIGIVWAMARFSYFVVAVGNVASAGDALTGTGPPSPPISTAATCLTKSGASSGTANMSERLLVALPSVT